MRQAVRFGGASFAIGAALVAAAFAGAPGRAAPTAAAPLAVTITSPADRSRLAWQSQASYAVTAVYRGQSTAYGELPPNDVVVEARFVPDVDAPAQGPQALPPALVAISQSNCSGCHDFNASGAGPSFAAVAARYARQPGAGAALAAHIRNGSSGAWGAAAMPPHPDMSPAEARAVADWIVGHAGDPSVRYAIGKEGSIRMSAPARPGPKASMVLTAFYTGPLTGGDSARSGGPHSRITILGIPGR